MFCDGGGPHSIDVERSGDSGLAVEMKSILGCVAVSFLEGLNSAVGRFTVRTVEGGFI